MERTESRSRGVRLSDLDRDRVYRIAFVGRRWEVLGPEEPGRDEDAGPGQAIGSAGRGASEHADAYRPRHASPAPAIRPEAALDTPDL